MKILLIAVFRIFFALFYKVDIVNMDNIPKRGAALLCSNHISQLDMFLIGHRIPRMVYWMAKEELFRNPVVGAVMRCLGAFPIKRGKGDVGAMKKVYKLLGKGKIVGIFPEGTRTKGKLKGKIKAKPGNVLIAINSGVPIIPVAIAGNYKLFSRMRLIIGEPIKIETDKNKKYTIEEMSEISKGIMNKVYLLAEG